jgi:Meiotically up-regulated gene 113
MPNRYRLPKGMTTRPGRKGFYADFRVNGRRVQKKLGTNFKAARTLLAVLRARAECGIAVGPDDESLLPALLLRPSRPRPASRPVVYFVQVGEDGPIKIGHTFRPIEERLRDLRNASPYRLRLLLMLPGQRDDEQALHQRFAAARLEGEWFRPVPELLAFIEAQKAENPDAADDRCGRPTSAKAGGAGGQPLCSRCGAGGTDAPPTGDAGTSTP